MHSVGLVDIFVPSKGLAQYLISAGTCPRMTLGVNSSNLGVSMEVGSNMRN